MTGERQSAPGAGSNPNTTKAQDFLTKSQGEVLRAHPDLQNAFDARDQLRRIASEARPYNEAVAAKIDNTINSSVAASIARNQPIIVSERSAQDVQFQVAYQSAQHVASKRSLEQRTDLRIDDKHRDILINHAERSIALKADGQNKHQIEDLHQRAKETAGLVGSLDMPDSKNPFRDAKLQSSYNDQQNNLREQANQQQQDRQQGMQRGR